MKVQHLQSAAVECKSLSLLWTRALLNDLDVSVHPIASAEVFKDEIVGADPLELAQNIAVGGSGTDPRFPTLRRCGWAAFWWTSTASPSGSSTVRCRWQGRRFSLWQAIRIAPSGARVFSNCSYVGNGFMADQAASRESHLSDLWNKVFEAHREKHVSILKVKGANS